MSYFSVYILINPVSMSMRQQNWLKPCVNVRQYKAENLHPAMLTLVVVLVKKNDYVKSSAIIIYFKQ